MSENLVVKYFKQDIHRDPSQIRTEWIMTQLLRRPHGGDEIKKMAATNGLGFAPSTYERDLTGLVKRRLVDAPVRKGGNYSINPRDGATWAKMKNLVR